MAALTYKATGRRPGPPSAAPELIAEAIRLAAETTPEDAAATLKERGAKVSSRAIREWQKGMKGARHIAAEKLATIAIPPGLLTSPEPAPPPPDALPLVRRILKARDPSALAELDAGLDAAAKGEADLAAWLTRPLPPAEAPDLDPLDACVALLAAATAQVEKLSPLHPRAATILGAATNLAKTVENIGKGRPRIPTADEVTERIQARADEAVDLVMRYTRERAAKLERDRRDLVAWAGPLGPELARRLDAMLGGSS